MELLCVWFPIYHLQFDIRNSKTFFDDDVTILKYKYPII